MKYFIFENQRNGTCYHEFYQGKWDKHTFWKSDSLLLHDDILFSRKGFIEAILEVIHNYDPFGETEISQDEWNKIGKIISHKDASSQALYKEADLWLKNVFMTYDCFTILGI
ncbi:MAG: hypothetical protein E7603_05340 [Ruminococcaceae bacterium]|nr:hypothetical protein [Oscillospiraceae bacterium]